MVLLDKRQKRVMALLVVLMLIGAVLETAGVSLVIPVMNVVMDQHAVEKNRYLQVVCDLLHIGYEDTRSLMMVTMLVLIGVFVVKNVFLFFQQKAQLKFVYTNQFATSRRMMINFMQRPYEYYLNADTSVIQRSITSDVNNMYGLICVSGGGKSCYRYLDDRYGNGTVGGGAWGDQIYIETYHEKGGRRKPGFLQRSV